MVVSKFKPYTGKSATGPSMNGATYDLVMNLMRDFFEIKDIFLCLVMWKCKFNKSMINETITNITTQFQLMEIIMLSTNMGNNKITEYKGSGLKGKA
jgi:hypothetical protein